MTTTNDFNVEDIKKRMLENIIKEKKEKNEEINEKIEKSIKKQIDTIIFE